MRKLFEKHAHLCMLIGMLIIGGVLIFSFGRVVGPLQWIIAGVGVTIYIIGRIFAGLQKSRQRRG
ncbi:hypothetical protein [Chitinivibrio alkaliphilus]|uniref:Uncharacterized protein n=1 Tax=Chitinivibrio alkaliphilus ACht1 TaxID=1313304 RepID=U7DDF7_9BACT|nr:hypothetical protein [Chitinivibrio alkaliphilus]ERP38921.1 hypothetical protein CALK_0409 [Chitinivibrio alkaliphilus ACht1]